MGVAFCSFFGAFLFTYVQLGVFPGVSVISLNSLKSQVASVAAAVEGVSEIVVRDEVPPSAEDIAPSSLDVPLAPTPEAIVQVESSVEGVGADTAIEDVSEEVALNEVAVPVTQDIEWSELVVSAPWAARDSGASFVFDNRLWYMGGLNGDGLPGEDHVVKYWEATYFNDVWSSPNGSEWQKESTHAAWSPRRSMSVAELNGVLFMYGGWSQTEGYVSDIWYSDDGYTWLEAPTTTPWSPREGQTLEVFDGKLWLIGGVNYDERKVFNDVWYSEDGLTWTEAPLSGDRWSGRWDHATAVFQDELYLVGGMNLKKETFGDVWKSRDGARWERVSLLPGATRQGHGLVSYAGELWTIGRLNDVEGGGENDIWHSSDGVSWERADMLPSWTGREDHAVHVLNDAIYVYGGMSADWVWMHDVWKGEIKE